MERRAVTATVAAAPDAVFALVTDIDRLPEWNAIIQRVVERPDRLVPDAEWVVELSAMGRRWNSRSRAIEVMPDEGRFRYRSQSDDGNPSFGIWEWTVVAAPGGSAVTVSWELHPKTFWRRMLLVRMRDRMLRTKEVPASFEALERVLGS
jgi:uncharacterized protein YndB with AHSA1/START domain